MCIPEPGDHAIVSGHLKNLPVIILFKLNVKTGLFQDHTLVHVANVRGIVGKLYVSTVDRSKFYVDQDKEITVMDDNLNVVHQLGNYILTGRL